MSEVKRGVPVVDMGIVHGKKSFYTHGRSIRELMEDGELVAIPDKRQGVVYKRTASCSPVERAAQLTIDEAAIITAAWNAELDKKED